MLTGNFGLATKNFGREKEDSTYVFFSPPGTYNHTIVDKSVLVPKFRLVKPLGLSMFGVSDHGANRTFEADFALR